MKSAEEWYAENQSLAKIDLGGIHGLIEDLQKDAIASRPAVDIEALAEETTNNVFNHFGSDNKGNFWMKPNIVKKIIRFALLEATGKKEG